MNDPKKSRRTRFHREKAPKRAPLPDREGPPSCRRLPPQPTPSGEITATPRGEFFDYFFPNRPRNVGGTQ